MKCKNKHRTRTTKKKGSSNNHPALKGCSWEKIIKNGVHIGRKCTSCNRTILNPRATL